VSIAGIRSITLLTEYTGKENALARVWGQVLTLRH